MSLGPCLDLLQLLHNSLNMCLAFIFPLSILGYKPQAHQLLQYLQRTLLPFKFYMFFVLNLIQSNC